VTALDRPAPEEIEVTVFGRGFGEAICVHVDQQWFLIDSCLNPETGAVASLEYLEDLELNPADAVELVLVTHWDDDHIKGIGRIVDATADATVVCSAALTNKDVLQFVFQQASVTGAAGSGLDELRSVLVSCRATGRLVWAKACLPLHPRSAGGTPIFTALSPSDDAVARSIESLISAAKGAIAYPRQYKAPEGPNGASVAAAVRAGEKMVLLGADLSNSDNPLSGWEAVLGFARPDLPVTLVKVPHHGSAGAHHDGMWSELVEAGAIAILTPWTLAGRFLPLADDIDRLKAVAEDVYLTAMPTIGRAKKNHEVDKLLTKVANVRVDELRGWGRVRARRKLSEDSWRVELAGDAIKL
jgi:hypothetical protein